MKAQQALETKTTEKPIFVEAEKLINRMEEMTKNIAQRAYEFFEERGRRFGYELDDWFRAESELMRRVPTTMTETDEAFAFQAEVPGFKANEIKISAEPRQLMIEGDSEQTTEEKSEKVVFSERRTNRFCRSFSLSAEIDPSKVSANLKDGVLEIILPKVPVRQAVGVEIKTA